MGIDAGGWCPATAADCRRRRSSGFTLLEVVVAVTIAGLALVGLFQGASAGLFAADEAGHVDEAIERAPSHLAAFGRAVAIVPGAQEGDEGGGDRWRWSGPRAAVQPPALEGPPHLPTTLFDATVTISWRAWG